MYRNLLAYRIYLELVLLRMKAIVDITSNADIKTRKITKTCELIHTIRNDLNINII